MSEFQRKGLDPKKLLQLRERYWSIGPLLAEGLPPIPRFDVRCPVCGCEIVCIKEYVLHERAPGEYRCDVYFKCMCCGHVWGHGLHLINQEYNMALRWGRHRTWRDYGHICKGV